MDLNLFQADHIDGFGAVAQLWQVRFRTAQSLDVAADLTPCGACDIESSSLDSSVERMGDPAVYGWQRHREFVRIANPGLAGTAACMFRRGCAIE
jgi:hypothetical protein